MKDFITRLKKVGSTEVLPIVDTRKNTNAGMDCNACSACDCACSDCSGGNCSNCNQPSNTPKKFVFLGVFAIIKNMKYEYRVILDKERDAWNWFDASQNPSFQGCNWHNFLHDQDLEFFNQITKLSSQNAKLEIGHFLTEKYVTNENLFIKQTTLINEKLSEKFLPACEWLKKTTGHPLFFHNYIIYLTTFPRSPYQGEDCQAHDGKIQNPGCGR